MSSIPLSTPSFIGNEWKYVKECIDTAWVSSAGEYVDLFEQKVSEYTGSEYAVAVVNGTSALHVSLRIVGVQPGEEVIVPTLTFIAPVNAIAYNGATPVFMDADEYYNIDAEKTIEFIRYETDFKDGFTYNKKTGKKISAIIPVHVWGNAAWLDELSTLCNERRIAIVEDASESLGTVYSKGIYSGRHSGTVGKVGCLSFNGNKIITTGGGGMILTDDQGLAEKAHYLTTQAKDDRVRYIHDEIGYNYRLTNIQAALGVAQLEQLPGFLKRKKKIHRNYLEAVDAIEGLAIAGVPSYADNNHWLNLVKIDRDKYEEDREELMKRLNKKRMLARPMWTLNHLQKPYKEFQSYKIERSMEVMATSLCLPSSINLNREDIDLIIKSFSSLDKIA